MDHRFGKEGAVGIRTETDRGSLQGGTEEAVTVAAVFVREQIHYVSVASSLLNQTLPGHH